MTSRTGIWTVAGLATLTIMLIIALLPMYWMALASFRPDVAIMQWPPAVPFWASELTTDAWQTVLSQDRTIGWVTNSITIALGSVFVSLVVATPAAYALSRGAGHVLGVSSSLLFLSKLLPASVLITPLYVLVRSFGLINSPMAVLLGNLSFAVPLATFFLKNAMDALPRALDEAASLDGASRLRTLLVIVIPNIAPALAAVAIYVFVVSWNDFIFARTFLTGSNTTITVGTTMFMGEYETRWNQLMAVGCMATIPCLAFFLLLQRHLLRGLQAQGKS